MDAFTETNVLAAIREAQSRDYGEPFVSEQETGHFVIDGKFDLPKLAELLNELAHKSA